MKMRKRSTVVLASCGDGATNTGPFHEAMNFASVQKVPMVLVIENNGYAYSTPSAKQFAIQNLSERAKSYGIPGESVDGNDVLAVFEAVNRAVAHARSGNGPAIVECKTFRGAWTLRSRQGPIMCRKSYVKNGLLKTRYSVSRHTYKSIRFSLLRKRQR